MRLNATKACLDGEEEGREYELVPQMDRGLEVSKKECPERTCEHPSYI